MGRAGLIIIDRLTGTPFEEKVYGAGAIRFLYGDRRFSRTLGAVCAKGVARFRCFSRLYGWWQTRSFTRKKIFPFIREYGIDVNEFFEPLESFQSFNDFFIRRLKPEARPIAPGKGVITAPADGRYRFISNIELSDGFYVKGAKFCLETFLQSAELAKAYRGGSMVIARLCPIDYHRFHFPCDSVPGVPKLINGLLYSVNPLALAKNIHILSQNKRVLTSLSTGLGEVIFVEVGATNVGSIVQTFRPGIPVGKGDEKGYFSFGGSLIAMLFAPGKAVFDQDVVDYCSQGYEVRCLMGQSIGKVL